MTKQWGTVKEATAILSEKAGRPIDPSYVRSIKKIRSRKVDGRTNEYNLEDCRNYVVTQKSSERKPRYQPTGKPAGRPRKQQIVE